MPRVLNPNLAKIHRNYSVEEAADLFGVHKNSVRSWIKSGLPVCDARRPTLILGRDLRDFLKGKRKARKCRCGKGELFCLRCRAARKPAEGMVDYVPISCSTGRLIALCPICAATMNRYVGSQVLAEFRSYLDVRMP